MGIILILASVIIHMDISRNKGKVGGRLIYANYGKLIELVSRLMFITGIILFS